MEDKYEKKEHFAGCFAFSSNGILKCTPAFAESLTDGETAVMETAEETKTEPMEEIQEENTEAEQMPVLTEVQMSF